jgi:nicotinamide mononucleotide (NMN) deamidase PncC
LFNSLLPPDWQQTARAIHASGRQLVIALTGGGSGALAALLQTPGASRSMLEAVVPYSLASLIEWIGGRPDQACSETTARAMAMAAFVRARRLSPDADAAMLVGIGCTASLATDRPKRGERRIHAAVQTLDRTEVHSLRLQGESPTRAHDEEVAGAFLLAIIAQACGAHASAAALALPPGQTVDMEAANAARRELLLGKRRLAIIRDGAVSDYSPDNALPSIKLVFAGAFNPPHVGHLRMAEIAERRVGAPLAWELSVANVDKPPLDFISIRQRVAALRAEDGRRLIALTSAPTFAEKSALFPGATFVVGADTLQRIAEHRYYGDDAAKRDRAIADIAGSGCRFLVFGRAGGDRFMTLGDLQLPEALRRLCEEVPASEFREDVSSTSLRQSASGF